MQGHQYGLMCSQQLKLKSSIVRPQSQHRPTSLTHHQQSQKKIVCRVSPHRQSFQISANQYYAQGIQNTVKQPLKQFSLRNRRSSNTFSDVQALQKIRKSLYQKMQRWMSQLREQIRCQSAQLITMERRLQQQNQEIQTKNSIIKTLIIKLQISQQQTVCCVPKESTFYLRRVEDAQNRLRLLMQQIEEERNEVNCKLENVGKDIIRYFGQLFKKVKGTVAHFLLEKGDSIDKIWKQINIFTSDANIKIEEIYKNIQKMKIDTKNGSDCFTRESTQSSHSKDPQVQQSQYSYSLSSDSSLCKNKKQESLFSDYFFLPNESEISINIKTMENLVRQRQHLLPIRVFVDSMGRLKYWESRTFIFDRQGNFTSPSSEQLGIMEQRGWLKVAKE